MSSLYGIRQRHETHRELGFFDRGHGWLTGVIPLLGGLFLASSTWSSGPLAGLLGFLAGTVATATVITLMARGRRRRRMDAWQALLAEAGVDGIEVLELVHTSRGLQLELSLSMGSSFSQAVSTRERVEVAAGLSRGAVRMERDDEAAEVVWLHAALYGAGRPKDATLPPDPGAGYISVTDPVAIGTYDDGKPCTAQLGHTNTIVAASSVDEAGIEQFFRVLIAQLVRCDNTLIWLAGPGWGRVVSPWLHANPPALDWPADDLSETERVLRAAVRVAHERSRRGPGGDRLQPSPAVPAVVVMLPDVGLLLRRSRSARHDRITELALELAHIGPREAVTMAAGARLDTVISDELLELRQCCGLRIGLGIAHHPQAASLFPDLVVPDRDALSDAGTMQVLQAQARSIPASLFDVTRQDAGQIAQECANRRPALDDLSATADDSYADRWTRWHTASAS